MASWQSQFLKFLMRLNLRTMDRLNVKVWDEDTSVSVWRDYCENGAAKAKLPAGVEVIPVKIECLPAGLSAEWLKPVETSASAVEEAVIFYTHGGG